MSYKTKFFPSFVYILVVTHLLSFSALPTNKAFAAIATDYTASPPFVTAGVPPIMMLVMGRNHKLYYEAYNDASDLNDDGVLDVGYNPAIEYYGYFDSYKYYSYSTANSRFEPAGVAIDKKAPSGAFWSGDFLNYLSMTRMDCLRKVLYGGYRSTDTATETVLQRVFVPQDAHSWGKEYESIAEDGFDIREYTPLDLPKGGSRHLFASTTLSDNGTPILRVLENSIYRIWEWVAIERPVAGAKAIHGSNGPAVTDNGSAGGTEPFDETNGGAAGIADDSYTPGSSPTVILSDEFSGTSIASDWSWTDEESHSSTSRSQSGGELIIEAAGADVWEGSGDDQYAALYLEDISGNFDFKLRVSYQQNTNGWAKTGIMVKNDMTASGSSTGYCIMSITPSNGFNFQPDTNEDGFLEIGLSGGSSSTPEWIRLTKEGNLFTGYYGSSDGTTWSNSWSATISSAEMVQDVGIFVTSHNAGTISECRFDAMELTSLVPNPPDPDLAFDDDPDTKWNYPDEPTLTDPIWISFAFSDSKEIKSYTINAGSDAPEDWILQGSVDETTWVDLDIGSNETLTAGTKKSFECDTSAVYKYYRLLITESSSTGTDGLSIAEIELRASAEPIPATATLTDYAVKVKVCDPVIGLEKNAQLYSETDGLNPVYKPVGILQEYGETDRMYFGLLTGSYTKNTSGGVLRKNIRSITDEINPDTGQFYHNYSSIDEGIIETIDSFRVVDFDYGSYAYDSSSARCGWITTRSVGEGECRMWGNPVAEMMYESLRYFSGVAEATPDYTYDPDSTDDKKDDDNDLGLPTPAWIDPYAPEDDNGNGELDEGEDDNENGLLDGFLDCAKPFLLVLSDINPTYDSDQLPGSPYGSITTSLGTMDVASLADTISFVEGDITTHFIGEAATYDGACSPKSISGFGHVRGLCPEEPTKQGSYYSSAVAYYGNKTDLHATADGDQRVASYFVGLASPIPTIDIKIGESSITLVPFAKSVGGSSISATEGDFQPTNTIVDFFVDTITSTFGKFRINFEDVEQGADHDMDAIVEYTYQVLDADDNAVTNSADGVKVKLSLNSTYAAGGMIQHMGYIVSGSTKDGTYLEVRDYDTGTGSDPDYFLDTPPGVEPGGAWDDDTALPLVADRTFFPGTSEAATLLKNPLWYAAKWGGFQDYNDNDLPDQQGEWDEDGNGIPDTYFYVQNALKLEEQLNQSFADILRRAASGTAASVISQSRSGEGAVYQAIFYPETKDRRGNTVSWVGSLHALFVDRYGNMREDSNANQTLDIEAAEGAEDSASNPSTDRVIVFDDAIVKKYKLAQEGLPDLDVVDPESSGTIDDIKFLWRATDWLNELPDSEVTSQRIYNSAINNRYIFTFIDNNLETDDSTDINMVVDSSAETPGFEYLSATDSDLTDETKIFPYLNLFPTFTDANTLSIIYNGNSIGINDFRNKGIDPEPLPADPPPTEEEQNAYDAAAAEAAAAREAFNDFLKIQTERVINYIRGEDQEEYISTDHNYALPAFRSRQVDYDDDGTAETWRLGDIVYSTPTVVGRPAENYHLLYGDQSYVKFLSRFQNRRQVVYAGSNDGLFHAFNGGFYDNVYKKFDTAGDSDNDGTDDAVEYALGAEMWAYIPYNLLPHLYWLTEPGYPHVYYNDLQPKVFDAKILPKNTYYTDDDSDANWGTFLVGGMRLGGGRIIADMDKTDGSLPLMEDQNGNGVLDDGEDINGNGALDQVDRIMTSAYYIFDITDPEQAPKLIAEISLNQMGYTLCNPTVVPMKSKDSNTPNNWYLVFGSGPADENGYAAGHDKDADAGIDNLSSALKNVISEQPGKLFVIDLKALVAGETKVLQVLDGDGNFQAVTGATGTHYYQSFDEDENAMISDPVTADYDLDFSADAVYFGTVEGDSSGWGGKMRRIVIDNDADTTTWDGDSILFDTRERTDLAEGQPISAEANVAIDNNGRMWVYFGTGRYYVKADEAISTQQTFYGFVEPFDDEPASATPEDEPGFQIKTLDEPFLWTKASYDTLLNVSSVEIRDDKSLTVKSTADVSGINDLDDPANGLDWNDLIGTVDTFTTKGGGWMMDFRTSSSNFVDISARERNLSQSVLFGEVITFSTYTPSGDMCSYEGSSNLYALYYKTGTSYYESIVGFSHDDTSGDTTGVVETGEMVMKKMLSLGKGLSGTPNIHSGEDEGTKAYVQTSTGDIITIKQLNPGIISSGVTTWQEGTEECQ